MIYEVRRSANPAFNRLYDAFRRNNELFINSNDKNGSVNISAFAGAENDSTNPIVSFATTDSKNGKELQQRITVRPLKADMLQLDYSYKTSVMKDARLEERSLTLSFKEAGEKLGEFLIQVSPEFSAFVYGHVLGQDVTAAPLSMDNGFAVWRTPEVTAA